MAVAAKYMRLAGYPSGKYTGSRRSRSSARTNPSAEDAEIVDQTLKNLGFKTKLTLVEQAAMYSKYCGTRPKRSTCAQTSAGAQISVIPRRYSTSRSTARTSSPTETTTGCSNNPQINKAMKAAETVVGTSQGRKRGRRLTGLRGEAVAIPFDWDKDPNVESKDVAGVGDLWNTGPWDYSYTSLK